MNQAVQGSMVAHIRRLASDGVVLYIRIKASDVARLRLDHGVRVVLDLGGKCVVRGIVKTSGRSPWIAPEIDESNADITKTLRMAGLGHGDDLTAKILECRAPTVMRRGPAAPVAPTQSTPRKVTKSESPSMPEVMHFDPETARRAVNTYNSGDYRGRRNVEIDRDAYERFHNGLPDDKDELVELVRFVGEDYGGAQLRFLPHGYREEAALIVKRLLPVLDYWRDTVAAAGPLRDSVLDCSVLERLFEPFSGTKHWPVWASKLMHFLRPDAFPILDSRAKNAIGLPSLGSSPRHYHRSCILIREVLVENHAALAAAAEVDAGAAPSELKLLDKILYELGG